ncbi:glycosyltransferase [Mariprofundus ferrooxydans]|uniref:CgeB family protein n=1 Tax=Mariprofundus ferrooxydans TaxID=314344 RepID=UPI000364A794|nr:glycosyltransferase [Mariprofundus ferrooxydans]
MKLLLVCMKYDYGDPDRGYSYEWNHFYLGLKNYFKDVQFFDFYGEFQSQGQQGMQQALSDKIKAEKPDVSIFSLYTDQFSTEFVKGLQADTKTLCFFHDDGWRKDFVARWAPCFDVFTTTDPAGVRRYARQALSHAVYVPFGVNEQLFCPAPGLDKDIDVSFVGAWHPYREWLMSRLRKKGVKVEVFGYRWPNGMLSEASMIELFQRSKISINMTNCPSWDVRYLLSSPRALWNRFRSPKVYEQIKGRHFEIPACGAMQLSYYVDGLEKLFDPGNEVVLYQSPEELVDKAVRYLNDPEELERVTQNGLSRARKEHAYGVRFQTMFQLLGWYE